MKCQNNFSHPDDDWSNEEDMTGAVNDDRYNIMNSGPLFQVLPLESKTEFYIRRYQWNKIQMNH